MDRQNGTPGIALPLVAAAAAAAATILVALSPSFRYGGLLSPLGLWIAGAAGVGLLLAGATLPSARSGTSALRRSLSLAGLVAAGAVAVTGIGSVAALGSGTSGSPGPTPGGWEPAPVPAEPAGVSAVVELELAGAVNAGAKTDAATCSADPAGTDVIHYHADMSGVDGLPVTADFDVDPNGRVTFLVIGVSAPGDEFQFAAGKYWEAAPPWITPADAPTQRNGSATLTGLVDVVQPPDANPGAPAREVSGTLTWACVE
jgi:hypothetical protein